MNFEHLFNDRNFDMDITISAGEENMNTSPRTEVNISIRDKLELNSSTSDKELQDLDEDLILSIIWSNSNEPIRFGISHEGYTSSRGRSPVPRRLQQELHPPVQFIQTNGMSSHAVKVLFDNVVLTDSEKYVVDALRIIEPSIERIATAGSETRFFRRQMAWGERPRGIFIRSADSEQRMPIGSVGDGIWRMLGLALAMAGAKRRGRLN